MRGRSPGRRPGVLIQPDSGGRSVACLSFPPTPALPLRGEGAHFPPGGNSPRLGAMRISVRAHPGAPRERVEWQGDVLHVWVTARAVEGQANRALVRAVARGLGVRPSAVTLVAGQRGRDK